MGTKIVIQSPHYGDSVAVDGTHPVATNGTVDESCSVTAWLEDGNGQELSAQTSGLLNLQGTVQNPALWQFTIPAQVQMGPVVYLLIQASGSDGVASLSIPIQLTQFSAKPAAKRGGKRGAK